MLHKTVRKRSRQVFLAGLGTGAFGQAITLVVAPPCVNSMSMLRGLVFQAPAVKSGMAMELERLSTDHWLSGMMELQAAAS